MTAKSAAALPSSGDWGAGCSGSGARGGAVVVVVGGAAGGGGPSQPGKLGVMSLGLGLRRASRMASWRYWWTESRSLSTIS